MTMKESNERLYWSVQATDGCVSFVSSLDLTLFKNNEVAKSSGEFC